MSQPNNILGFQYMKAILSQNSSIQAQTIKDLPLIIMMKHLMTNILQARQASENNSLAKKDHLQQLNLFSHRQPLRF